MTDAPDYRSTVFLPRTDFPMKAGLAQAEPRLLERWKAMGLYEARRAARSGREPFIFHDGPPYANGDIHIGHAMNKVLKDLVVRSQALLGRDAQFVPGWDCHGLPIEWKIEEEFRKARRSKDEVPAAEFRARCREFAAHWVGVQKAQFERLGVLADWDNPYLTMDYAAEAAIVAELLKFAATGQLYRGAKPVMWSPVEQTALAEAEVEYEDVTSTQIDVAFEIVEAPNAPELVGAYAVVWTTTPWTIPVNQALAYNPDVAYILAEFHPAQSDANEPVTRLLIAKKLLEQVEDRLLGTITQVRRIPGTALAGALALHPMHGQFRHSRESGNPSPGSAAGSDGGLLDSRLRGNDDGGADSANRRDLAAFFDRPRPFLPGDFVTTDQGTGLVHMAPDHGEDDFALCARHGIGPVFAVEPDGRYRADWPWLGGQGSVINPKFNAPDGPICTDLARAGALLSAAQDYRHSYPHSWRSKARLIYRATPQWFIAIDRPLPPLHPPAAPGGPSPRLGEERRDGAQPAPPPQGEGDHAQHGGGASDTLRARALAAIAHTRFVPERGRNRIRTMVEGRPDWLISRQRAWGVPITLFVNRKTGDYLRDPDVDQRIVAAVAAGGADAWVSADPQALLGNAYSAEDWERVTDILDVWFDSGSTHAFVLGPRHGVTQADLYLEGSDQHRGWFQSSLLECVGTRGHAPYKAVMTHGFTMDGDGRKMSKSLGNVVDPLKVIETSGADILRLWVASSGYFDDVRIGKDVLAGTSEAYRKLRNTLRYLLGALDGWDEAERVAPQDMPELERWVLHRLAELSADLRQSLEAYDFTAYITAISTFANADLSAFWFDVRKDSLYCDAPDSPKRRAVRTVMDTLFHALVRWLSPVLVFTAEEAWAARFPAAGSVHLLDWPSVDEKWLDQSLAASFALIRSLARGINTALDEAKKSKEIRSTSEASVVLLLKETEDVTRLQSFNLAEIYGISGCYLRHTSNRAAYDILDLNRLYTIPDEGDPSGVPLAVVQLEPTKHHKCARCWRHLPEVGALPDPNLCQRCHDVVHADAAGPTDRAATAALQPAPAQ